MPSSIVIPKGYQPQCNDTLPAYLSGIVDVAKLLGGAPADWSVQEVGDGNLNLVFIVIGKRGGVAVKQALPYVRLVGESWPLPLSRAHYEHMALTEQGRLTVDRRYRFREYQQQRCHPQHRELHRWVGCRHHHR